MAATTQRKQTIRRRLKERGQARESARQTEAKSIDAIAQLLREGQNENLTIKEMAELAGITRQTAYTLLGRKPQVGRQ